MRAINLLPPDSYAAKQRLPHAPTVLAASVPLLAGALIYLGYSVQHSTVVDRQQTLGLVQSQLAALRPSPQLASESAGVASDRSARQSELADVLSKQIPWDVMFDRISRVLPSDAWLTSLTAQSPTPSGGTSSATAPSATAFTIQGYAYSQASVAYVLSRLAVVPGLSEVSLASTNLSAVGSKNLVQFNITASVQGAS